MAVFGGRLIAHRGNRIGPYPARENSPQYLDEALMGGFDCEIDFWVLDGVMKLGHDHGQYPIDLGWLRDRQKRLWIHCKNPEAVAMMANESFNWFFHNTDAYTLTSEGYVWSYPGAPFVGSKAVIVYFGRHDPTRGGDISSAYGICGDFVGRWGDVRDSAAPLAKPATEHQ